uniref:Putative LRR receptor-like serine/threonine-protein kinase At1g56130 n=1 Tax=Rhizophora mucronata TaxID=61149 RepID=A0A2P2MEC0_RHIMU
MDFKVVFPYSSCKNLLNSLLRNSTCCASYVKILPNKIALDINIKNTPPKTLPCITILDINFPHLFVPVT